MARRVISFLPASSGTNPARGRERGSATVWVLALMAMVWCTAAAVLLGGQVRAVRHQAGAAADLAALAAADRALHAPGVACRTAAEIADANGAHLRACAVEGGLADVTVEVQLPALIIPLVDADGVTARARAGPAGTDARVGPAAGPARSYPLRAPDPYGGGADLSGRR